MSVMSDAQKLKILLPCLTEALIIHFTGLLAVCLSAVRKKGFFGTDIYMGEKVFSHVVGIALGIFSIQSFVFVQVDRSNLGKIQISFLIVADQLFVDSYRTGACSKSQHTVRLLCHNRKNNVCCFSAYLIVISGFDNPHFSLSPF